MELQVGDQVVGRMWRWDAERLRIDALIDRDYRLSQGQTDVVYSISVFACPPVGAGADLREAKGHVIALATAQRSAKWIAFTTRSRLEAAGFPVCLSEPPEGHHDVVLGRSLEEERLELLQSIFNEQERQRIR